MTHLKEGVFPVLVVEDNPGDQRLAGILLGEAWPFEHGIELHFAEDGQEALIILQTKRFALVVLDWRLPVLGNGEVLHQLRRQGIRVPVVVLSGSDRDHIGDDLDELAAGYLHKDQMNPSTLQQAIADSLALLGLTKPPMDLLVTTPLAVSSPA